MNDQALVDLYFKGKSKSSINPAHLAGLRRVARAVWNEGEQAGEADILNHNTEGYDAECVAANPYPEK